MGVISLGSAWTAISGDSLYQLIGYLTGGLGGFIIALNQWRKFVGSPNFQWGLALVVPMVAATNAAQLGFIGLGRFGFILVWIIGVPVFVYVYFALMRRHTTIPVLLGHTVDSGGGCWAIHNGCLAASRKDLDWLMPPSCCRWVLRLVSSRCITNFALYALGRPITPPGGAQPFPWAR